MCTYIFFSLQMNKRGESFLKSRLIRIEEGCFFFVVRRRQIRCVSPDGRRRDGAARQTSGRPVASKNEINEAEEEEAAVF